MTRYAALGHVLHSSKLYMCIGFMREQKKGCHRQHHTINLIMTRPTSRFRITVASVAPFMKNIFSYGCVFAICLASAAYAQPSAFTYQGSLINNGLPVSGMHDFEFELFDDGENGTSVGSIIAEDVVVTGGLFSILLDFGLVFDGSERYLEIAVRSGNSTDEFTTLSPRQRISVAPYALRALEAATVPVGSITSNLLENGSVTAEKIADGAVDHLGTPDGSNTMVVTVENTGLVGIGTSDPQAGFDVATGSVFTVNRANLVFEVANGTGDFVDFSGNEGVAASGDLVAIASRTTSTVTLVDITDPENPVVQSQLQDGVDGFDLLSGVRRVALADNLLVISARNENAVTLVDVSDPTNPIKLIELVDNADGWDNLFGAMGVAIAGDLLAITAEFDDAVTIADISDPASPTKLVEIENGQFGFNNLDGPVSALFSGNLLFVGAWANAAVTIVDVTDPAIPVHLASLVNNEGGYVGLAGTDGLAVSGDLLAIVGNISDVVTLVDISDPANPSKLAEFQNGEFGVGEDTETVVFIGNLLAVTDRGESSLTLYEVSDPVSPRIAQRINNQSGLNMHLSGAYGSALSGTSLVVGGSQSMVVFEIETNELINSITTIGSVGIGTNAPLATLHVEGNGYFEGDAFEVFSKEVHFENNRFSVTAIDDLTFRARGGVRFFTNVGYSIGAELTPNSNSWSTISDRKRKKNIRPLDGTSVLEKLAKIPVSTWHYKFEPDGATPHIGPMAQDFKNTFFPGRNNKSISTHEFDGVALAAIQGLNKKLEEKDAEIKMLTQSLTTLQEQVRQLVTQEE